jgi:transposase
MESTPLPSEKVVRRLRLYPDPETKATLRRWFGCVRATYNAALERRKTHPKSTPINKFWLRNRFVNACNVPVAKRYLLDTPKHVREGAIEDLVLAYKTNFAKRAMNPQHTFDISFRSKKADEQSILIPTCTCLAT